LHAGQRRIAAISSGIVAAACSSFCNRKSCLMGIAQASLCRELHAFVLSAVTQDGESNNHFRDTANICVEIQQKV